MDLKTFVAETLQQICQGVREAQSKEGGDAINAQGGHTGGHLVCNANGTFTRVDFDVAVSAETEGGGKGGIKVFSIGELEGGVGHKTGYRTAQRNHLFQRANPGKPAFDSDHTSRSKH